MDQASLPQDPEVAPAASQEQHQTEPAASQAAPEVTATSAAPATQAQLPQVAAPSDPAQQIQVLTQPQLLSNFTAAQAPGGAPLVVLPNAAAAAAANPQTNVWAQQAAWLGMMPQAFGQQQPYLAAATTTAPLNPLQPTGVPAPLILNPLQPGASPAMVLPNTLKRTAADDDIGGQKKKAGGPSVVSNNSKTDELKPPVQKSEEELGRMDASERRRYERNLREQQRSYKISQQIKQLRDVLQESNIPFRPNKYSILVSVAEYIKQLQSRAIMLDSEHQRLIDTIKEAKGKMSSDTTENNNQESTEAALENDALFVHGIDYRGVFQNCPYPLGVATLDGRVLACNSKMEELLSAEKNSMTDQSFFVYIRNHQEIFEAMAALLKRSTATIETGEGTVTKARQLLFWCGHILSPKNEKFPFTITLTNTADDNPKFFSLSAATSPPL